MDLKPIISKISSGKFILTMMIGITFTTMSLMGKLPEDKVMEVVLIVIYGYFTRIPTKKDDTNGKP